VETERALAGLALRELRDLSVTELRAVGPKLAAQLAEVGIVSVLDLLEHYPRRYHDRTNVQEIAQLKPDEEATVAGTIKKVSVRRPPGRRPIVELELFDGTSQLRLTFFNQEYRGKIPVDTEVSVFGRPAMSRGRFQMINPAVDVLEKAGEPFTGILLPIYPQSGKAGIHSWQIRKLVSAALQRCESRSFYDPLDSERRAAFDLVDRATAYQEIHRPEGMNEVARARKRLTFDEFMRMQLGMVARKRAIESTSRGISHIVDGSLVSKFLENLPFTLTEDQSFVCEEIFTDLAAPGPMHRLLQGEVGSGKTVLALAAMLVAVQGEYQGAFMAPTEVLVEQHALTLRAMVKGLTISESDSLLGERPVGIALLTNKTTAAERRKITEGLSAGVVDIVVGTHALIYDGIQFSRLGVIVIDEQHRFGVEQRDVLRGKGDEPDVLVMTATPIPRTAAMLIYGDLDKSELRTLPAGRSPIATSIVGPGEGERSAVYSVLTNEIAEGRQAFVVCPLVEESDKLEAKAATEEFERLGREELEGLRLGLLHGQMPSAEKESVMNKFRDGDLDVLVATTVVEVGVDIPNATVMVIENADRFGLLQLHQLRGRIGRGAHASQCFLLAEPSTPEGQARLDAMCESNDGFELAERDLEIRGSGAVFGERQSGFTDLKLGRLPRDEPVVIAARVLAETILDSDPNLSAHAQLREEVEDLLGDSVEFLFKS